MKSGLVQICESGVDILSSVASITYYVCQSVFPIYLSHFSLEWTEIWHDDSLDGIDRAYSQNEHLSSG